MAHANSDLPITYLKRFIAQHGTQKAAAQALGLSAAYLSDLLHNRRMFSPRVLEALGLEQQTTIRRKQAVA